MPRGKRKEDLVMLQMALIGYLHEREQIGGKIQELQARLKGTHAASGEAAAKPAGGKRAVSPAARRRMAAAQKRRWAEHKKRLAAVQA